MRNVRFFRPALLGVLFIALAPGCATKIYQGPTTGRSAEHQLTVTSAAESAVGGLDFEPLRGRKVFLDIFGLTPEGPGGRSPEEDYLQNLLVERLVAVSATPVSAPAEADVVLLGALRTAGVDVIRRDFPPFWHHTTFRGRVDLRLITYGVENGTLARILRRQQAARETTYREIYVFYIIGPIRTTDVEGGEPAQERGKRSETKEAAAAGAGEEE